MKPSVLSMGSKVPLPAALRDGGMTRLAGIAVLLLLPLVIRAQGSGTRAEADALFISAKTVSVHVSNILGKLGASGRTEAAAIARRRGLLG